MIRTPADAFPPDVATPHGRAASGCTTVEVGAAGALDEPAEVAAEEAAPGTAVDSSDESNDGGAEFLFECDEHAVDNKPTAPSIAAVAASRRADAIRRISDLV